MIQLRQSAVAFNEECHSYYLGEKRLVGITGLIHQMLKLGEYGDASDFVNGHILYVDGGILAYIGKQP